MAEGLVTFSEWAKGYAEKVEVERLEAIARMQELGWIYVGAGKRQAHFRRGKHCTDRRIWQAAFLDFDDWEGFWDE